MIIKRQFESNVLGSNQETFETSRNLYRYEYDFLHFSHRILAVEFINDNIAKLKK